MSAMGGKQTLANALGVQLVDATDYIGNGFITFGETGLKVVGRCLSQLGQSTLQLGNMLGRRAAQFSYDACSLGRATFSAINVDWVVHRDCPLTSRS